MNKMMLAVAVTAAFAAVAMDQTKAKTTCPVMGKAHGKTQIPGKYNANKQANA